MQKPAARRPFVVNEEVRHEVWGVSRVVRVLADDQVDVVAGSGFGGTHRVPAKLLHHGRYEWVDDD